MENGKWTMDNGDQKPNCPLSTVRYPIVDRYSSYSTDDSIASTPFGLSILTLTNQPAPYGSLLTFSGVSLRPSFTSTISPAIGVKTSETAFTDSTEPKASWAVNLSPTRGRSM